MPAIIGARKIPIARYAVATKNRASWRCQVRVRLIREPLRDVEAEEVARLRVIVSVGAATEPLEQEQSGHDQEEPDGRSLTGREANFARLTKHDRVRRVRRVVGPTKGLETPEREQRRADAGEQRDERDRRPKDRVRRSRVLPTAGAGGQLFVYEYDLPGRFAVETQAAHEK